MKNGFFRICSIILVLVLLTNMLPLNVFAESIQENATITPTAPAASAAAKEQAEAAADSEVYIVEEISQNRTEFSKEFLLSNGLHMATVYPNAVHYKTADGWEEIDNTLIAKADGTITNTAGVWDVSFPQQLSRDKSITIKKDGYTLSFFMAGELTAGSGAVVMAAGFAGETGAETLAVTNMQQSAAAIQQPDLEAMRESMQYEQMVPEKLRSKITYENVYQNTDVIYDMNANKVKESIVLEAYKSSLRGYRYTLDVGDMIPVLNTDNSIWFYDSNRENVVMVMPAPFMVDSEGEYNDAIQVQLIGSGSRYTLTYLLPQQWLAAEDRAWPVILDPVVQPTLATSNIRDVTIAENPSSDYAGYTSATIQCGYGSSWGKHYMLIQYTALPSLTSADVIVQAEVKLHKPESSDYTDPVEVHKVNDVWQSETVTWGNKPGFNEAVEDFAMVGPTGDYYWDVTDIVQGWYDDRNTGMLFKIPNEMEESQTPRTKQFWSSDYADDSDYLPILSITFRNNNGIEDYWDYTVSSAGRAGTGYVNNYTGNLMWVREDIGFGGNRMPVAISHIYNLNDATAVNDQNNANDTAGNAFGLGIGWRTNYNQRIFYWHVDTNYYGWEDADGTDHYFMYDATAGVYRDEDGLELTLTVNGSGTETYCITDKYGNKSYFDQYGRLTKLSNNQATQSNITITYDGQSYRISTITDGAGRVYYFTYDLSNLLMYITYEGDMTGAVSYVAFSYYEDKLIDIYNKGAASTSYTYDGNLLKTAQDTDGYKLEYTYSSVSHTWQPYRVRSVEEFSGTTTGGKLTFQYDHNQTTVTDHNSNKEIMQFNNWGNLIAIQDGEGRAQYAGYATDTDSDGKRNQLQVASKLQNTVANLLDNNSFEGGTTWFSPDATVSSGGVSYYGDGSLKLGGTGSAQYGFSAEAGKTYTLSAYVKTGSSPAYLQIGNEVSQTLPANSDWTRLEVSYTNASTNSLVVEIKLVNAGGDNNSVTYMDCVQLELAPTASRYNLINDGDFRYGSGWNPGGGIEQTPAASVPQLHSFVLKRSGTYTTQNRIEQTVKVSGAAGDSFVVGGWAMGNAVPFAVFNGSEFVDQSNREFGILVQFHYTDGTNSLSNSTTANNYKVRFNTDVENWQYAAKAVVAEKAYSYITVILAYDHNANEVYFDGIQLFKEEFGNSYTYDANGNVTSVTDLQKQTTTYQYTENKLTQIVQNGTPKMTYEYYPNSHNVRYATTGTGVQYEFGYDTYGNNTYVAVLSGSTVMMATATYSEDGNRLVSTTDTAGYITTYSYHPKTNVLQWVQTPEDTQSTRTSYTYDDLYRIATAQATTDTRDTMSVHYNYYMDQLMMIESGNNWYSFRYGKFGLTTAVSVGEHFLATYSYTNDANHYLNSIDIDFGAPVYYTYDDMGRLSQESFGMGSVTYTYDNNGSLAKTEDTVSGRTTTYYYDLIDRQVKYVEKGTNYSHSVGYTYDVQNNLSALVENINGAEHTTSYTYDDDNRVVTSVSDGITVVYTYDDLGRIVTQTTKNGNTTILTESYTYLPSAQMGTSARIATYTTTAPNGYSVTYSYTYDGNGNILSISDGTNTTSYVYDSANQLIRENNQAGGYTHTWEYDATGNILSRNVYAYTTGTLGTLTDTVPYAYGDVSWPDLLTGYDGQTITNYANGYMDLYGTTIYQWSQTGRLDGISMPGGVGSSFTYDADGMRISRTSFGSSYSYIYNGSSLSQMTKGSNNTLYFTYDANGRPLTVNFNGTVYYYATNLQGDVTAILNSAGTAVVTYTYDAWGNPLSTGGSMAASLGQINPLRYRGYVYDEETGLYYLQSRYYDPTIGRFISPDSFVSTGQGFVGNNMFAYCLNNPVRRKDVLGSTSVDIFDGDGNPATDDDLRFDGGKMNGGNFGGSYTYSYNPIDAGYSYRVDLSQAANSSVSGGGLYSNGYTSYSNYSNPNSVSNTSSKTASRGFTPDQQAVIELAKEYRNGISYEEANILVEWAQEYGIHSHGPMKHPNRTGKWSYTEHIGIRKMHIPICY